MPWTATITGKTFSNGKLTLNIELTNGTDTVNKTIENVQNIAHLKTSIKQLIDTQTSLESLAGAISTGLFDSTPDTLTQAEIERNDWLKDYARWIKIKKNLVDTGILTGSETQLTTLLTSLQTNFKPAYLNFI